MNKQRRRLARQRRAKTRLVREIREWTKTNWTSPPKRGRLRAPVLRLMEATDAVMLRGLSAMHDWLAPVLAFGKPRAPQALPKEKP